LQAAVFEQHVLRHRSDENGDSDEWRRRFGALFDTADVFAVAGRVQHHKHKWIVPILQCRLTDDAGADVVVIYDPTVGYTTSGSDNPRVELRQTTISGKNAGWFLNRTSATTLTVTQRIMKLPAVHKSVTVMQIFDTSNGHFVEVQTRVCRGKSYELSAAGAQYGCTAGGLYMVIYWVQRANATDTNNYIFLAP
jgi:hypothetical protein